MVPKRWQGPAAKSRQLWNWTRPPAPCVEYCQWLPELSSSSIHKEDANTHLTLVNQTALNKKKKSFFSSQNSSSGWLYTFVTLKFHDWLTQGHSKSHHQVILVYVQVNTTRYTGQEHTCLESFLLLSLLGHSGLTHSHGYKGYRALITAMRGQGSTCWRRGRTERPGFLVRGPLQFSAAGWKIQTIWYLKNEVNHFDLEIKLSNCIFVPYLHLTYVCKLNID